MQVDCGTSVRKLTAWLTLFLILALVIGTSGCGLLEETPAPSTTSTPTIAPSVTPSPAPDGNATLPELQVHFIDVGQGDAILLDLGEVEVLIDGGDRSPGVTAYIASLVDGPLEVMIATHPHADHIGGLIEVLDGFQVDEIWHNGDTETSQTYSDFMQRVNAEGAEVHEARRGDVITAGDLTFNVLHPDAPLVDDCNNNSIVLCLSYGEVDFMFTGDAEHEAEASIVVQSVVPFPEPEILKVGHHGSRTACSQHFLDVIQPDVAIYMAGEGNRYGHPHEETLAALEDIGAEVYGTDTHGTIVVATNGQDYVVITSSAPEPEPSLLSRRMEVIVG